MAYGITYVSIYNHDIVWIRGLDFIKSLLKMI